METDLFVLAMHSVIFAIAVITPVALLVACLRFDKGSWLRKVTLALAVSFVFGGMRWVGGSIASLQIAFFIHNPFFVPIWTLTGVLAAVFGLYAAKLLLDYSKMFGFGEWRAATAKSVSKKKKIAPIP